MKLEWYYPFSVLEYIFILLFFLLYILYIRRIMQVSVLLQSRKWWFLIKIPLRITYFFLLLFALLGPSFGYGRKFVEAVGKDIYVAIDLSRSMNSEDIAPTRLERAKFEINKMMNAFETDRLGLVIFGTSAFLQCPLTYDRAALNIFLQSIHSELLPNQGTDFYPPLRLVLDHLTLQNNDLKNFKSKIMILMSDGENFGEDTDELLKQYQQKGIKVFTVGIGTAKGGKIPVKTGVKKDKEGKDIITKLHFQSLQSIAKATGGAFFEISEHRNEIHQLIEALKEIKGQRLDLRSIDVSHNKYAYFLWIALGLICLDMLLIVKILKI